jgi:hypothetical protein
MAPRSQGPVIASVSPGYCTFKNSHLPSSAERNACVRKFLVVDLVQIDALQVLCKVEHLRPVASRHAANCPRPSMSSPTPSWHIVMAPFGETVILSV